MKGLLAKHAHRQSIGLLLGDREFHYCVMAATPLGRVEMAEGSVVRGEESLDQSIRRTLEPWLALRPRPSFIIGVPQVRVFHAARAIIMGPKKDPETWLQEALQTQDTRVHEMIIDVVQTSVGKRSMGGLVSCRRKWLDPITETLIKLEARLVRVEPGPCGLLRVATGRLKTPRGSKLSARFILGEGQGLALLVARGIPLHWRNFDLPEGGEPSALLGAFVALKMHARSWRVEAVIDSVLVHGRPEITGKLALGEFKARVNVPVSLADGPSLEPASIARGLAMGGLVEEPGFDLGREAKPPESIREIFPWAGLALQSVLLGGVVFLMADRAGSLEREHAEVRKSLAKFRWLENRTEADLVKEKKSLELKDKTAEAFLASRVCWSEHLRDLASRLPANTKATALQGHAELESLGGKSQLEAARKTFVLRLQTPIAADGVMPREIDDTLEAIRYHSRLKRDFPVIEVKDIKGLKGSEKGAGQIATYSLVCTRSAPKAPVAKSPEPGK